jgi:hypothetical protein
MSKDQKYCHELNLQHLKFQVLNFPNSFYQHTLNLIIIENLFVTLFIILKERVIL